jgi:UTP-glucose-1-phosphate uridylyltransferase
MVEKPKPADAPSNLAVVGRYVLPPRIFTLLEQTTPGAGGEIQLTDAIEALLAKPLMAARFAHAARARLEQDFDLWTTTRRLHGLIHCQDCGEHAPTLPESTHYKANAAEVSS